MNLYIIGTHHKHQFGPCTAFDSAEQACNAFSLYLKEQCVSLKIRTLAEEMSAEARRKWGISRTVPESVALELGIAHADCDPDVRERSQLDIRNEGLVITNGRLNQHSEETIQRNIRREYDKRENEWLRRLSQFPNFPVIFVCGYEHPSSLLEKARKCGLCAQIVIDEWTPETY
jgi:hypothetical protein